ncbi:type II toxin-antitoxin system RelE family toxin [Salibacterium lacus]|uniref:Type II toxin-antitoxin system RelE/ParE family toxin n=1 Tax=Salibacterium lacus TaxID=1898109 RepID=A0ABW5T625_9BACI
MKTLKDLQEIILETYGVELKFSEEVKKDLKSVHQGKRQSILLEILRRAKNGPLFKPDGLAESLHGNLKGFTIIKSKSLNIRIVYRPVDETPIRMEIIAIGPRDKKKAYKLAMERLDRFYEEMDE